MKRIITAALILAACSAIAAPPPAYRITVERQSIGDAPQLKAFEASAFTLRAQYTDSGTPIVLGAGDVPFAYWAWSSRAPAIVTSTYAIVSAASGTVDFTWSAGNMNTNGVGIYGMGITDSNGALTVVKHGTLVLTADPYASGADPVTFSTTVNWSAYTWIGVPDYVQTISVTTGTTWGASITTGHLSLVVSTNATGELDPVAMASITNYLSLTDAALTYATTSAVAAKVDTTTFNSTNSGLQAQINGLVASAGWTQAVIQGETAFITSSNTARQLYLTISGIGAKADSNLVWSTFLPAATHSTYTGATATALAGKLDAVTYSNSVVVTDRVSLVAYTANRTTDTNKTAALETNVAARLPTATYTAYTAAQATALSETGFALRTAYVAHTAAYAIATATTGYQDRVQQGTNNVAMQARIAAVESGALTVTNTLALKGNTNTPLYSVGGTDITMATQDSSSSKAIVFSGNSAGIHTVRVGFVTGYGNGLTLDGNMLWTSDKLTAAITNYWTTNFTPQVAFNAATTALWSASAARVARDGSTSITGVQQIASLVVTNSLLIAQTNNVGSELVTDGGFAASPLPWTLLACYTNNGQLVVDAGLTGTFAPSSAVAAVAGASYQVAFSNTTTGAGTITLVFGGVTNSITMPCEQKTVMVVARTTEPFAGTVNATALCAIDGVSIKRIGRGSGSVAGDWDVGSNLTVAVKIKGDSIEWNGGQSSNVMLLKGSQTLVGDLTVTGKLVAGTGNAATGAYSSVVGGKSNVAYRSYSFIGGGLENADRQGWSVIAGGRYNTIAASSSSVAGDAVIGGGIHNRLLDGYSVIAGGYGNTGGWAVAIGGGVLNTATGQIATVSGGIYNRADGDVSHAAGYQAVATSRSAWVWADAGDMTFEWNEGQQYGDHGSNTFNVRANGGFYHNDGTNEFKIDNGVVTMNGTAIGGASGATGSIISLTFGGSNYTAGTPSLQIVGGGVSTGYDGSAATFTFPVVATGTPLYAYTETDTQAIARLNIASNGLQSQVTTAQATGVAAHARADVAYTAAAAPNGAAITNVPAAWTMGTNMYLGVINTNATTTNYYWYVLIGTNKYGHVLPVAP